MKIVVVGAGEVGYCLTETLSLNGHDVTIIEHQEEAARQLEEHLNARILTGNGSSAEVLERAGVANCDFFLAMTADDRTNLVACSLAKALGLLRQSLECTTKVISIIRLLIIAFILGSIIC